MSISVVPFIQACAALSGTAPPASPKAPPNATASPLAQRRRARASPGPSSGPHCRVAGLLDSGQDLRFIDVSLGGDDEPAGPRADLDAAGASPTDSPLEAGYSTGVCS